MKKREEILLRKDREEEVVGEETNGKDRHIKGKYEQEKDAPTPALASPEETFNRGGWWKREQASLDCEFSSISIQRLRDRRPLGHG
ncbi:hypothetical protein [Thermoflexus sp.]|nr:hypothetical protein [Thermoflexus sp.]MCS6964878.1 hypothetical protein [Thermoflexus sp.]MCX7691344.1 hypothetical protein [Thermoflexus sp.]MDW8184362.1 hypothetical protein [Anaerolineae bacterium]